MAAPTGLSSGSAPEPVTPKVAAGGPARPEAADPELVTAEAAAAEPPAPGPQEPGRQEPEVPEPREPPAGDVAAADLDREPPAPDPDQSQAQPRRAGRLVAAVAIVVVLAAAAAAGALVVVTHGFRPKTIVSYQPAAVFSLRAGDCINSSPNGLSVTVLPCTSSHDAEVFATFSLAGSSWPGSAAVQQQAAGGCQGRLAGYLDPALLNAGLTQEYVYPDETAWKAGVRTSVCEVSSSTGPLTGSVRSAG
jgi:hypothetical protein